MNYSVDRTNTAQSFDDLDRIREDVLGNIDSVILGNVDANLTEEINRYFTEGISAYYVNLTFYIDSPHSIVTISASQMVCAIDTVYQYLFPKWSKQR